MPGNPFTLSKALAPTLPIVVDSPHSGTDYPADFGSVLTGLALRQGEDTWVHELWGSAPAHGATVLAANFPRAYIDPNRSLVDIDAELLDAPWPGPVEPSRKTELGIGLVWRLMDGKPIYDRRLAVAEIQRRIDRCWRPYHAALADALAAAGAQGPRWHLNVHSMPDDSYRRLGLPEQPLADFVLGNLDGSTCDEATIAIIEDALQSAGYSVARNEPFKGVEIIRSSGQPQRGWHSLQIEVKRSLYMDESRKKNAGFDRVQRAADQALAALAAHARRSRG
ncbi:MAG TPA: N-formylglutamate amidohydrolase [Rubrivivax sp.]|nr:N-formylglutamate amidohydrolase [Rubrivivax sp.]